LEGQVSF